MTFRIVMRNVFVEVNMFVIQSKIVDDLSVGSACPDTRRMVNERERRKFER